MKRVLRWGRSSYERQVDLEREREAAESLGWAWSLSESKVAPVGRADVLVVHSKMRVNGEVLDRLRPELVLTTTSGTDHIDLGAAETRGVAVGRSPLARRDPVVESAIGSLIQLLRREPAMSRAAREGRWVRGVLPELDPIGLSGATIGVVGLGVIGERVAQVLGFLGARVIGFDPFRRVNGVEPVDFPALLSQSDAISVHCSLTESSNGLFSPAVLAQMRPGAVLVNVARGEVVDVLAAVEAVREGALRGLAVDVFPVEPYAELASGAAVEGVIFSPHSAGFTRHLGRRVSDEIGCSFRRWALDRTLPFEVSR